MNPTALFGNPEANVSYNAIAGILVALGYAAIKMRWVRLHITCMLTALVTSALFLASYVDYHIVHGSTPFPGPTGVRYIYFPILVTHVVLAAIVPVLALYTAYLGLRGRFAKHVRVARWTLPLWLYVSVTGVIVYWMLYRMYAT
jgi:putative membrane protein